MIQKEPFSKYNRYNVQTKKQNANPRYPVEYILRKGTTNRIKPISYSLYELLQYKVRRTRTFKYTSSTSYGYVPRNILQVAW